MAVTQYNVCLIDDDQIYQFTSRKILEYTGLAKYFVLLQRKWSHWFFKKKLTQGPNELPDVIFLDINMPVMNGWQFLDEYHKILEQFKKPIYIYMVSSSVDDCDIQRSKEYSGVTDYIVKPINKIKYQELIDRLNFYNG